MVNLNNAMLLTYTVYKYLAYLGSFPLDLLYDSQLDIDSYKIPEYFHRLQKPYRGHWHTHQCLKINCCPVFTILGIELRDTSNTFLLLLQQTIKFTMGDK